MYDTYSVFTNTCCIVLVTTKYDVIFINSSREQTMWQQGYLLLYCSLLVLKLSVARIFVSSDSLPHFAKRTDHTTKKLLSTPINMTESSPINRAHNKENKRYHSMMYYYVHLYYNIGLTKRQQDKEHLQMWYIYDDDDDDGG